MFLDFSHILKLLIAATYLFPRIGTRKNLLEQDLFRITYNFPNFIFTADLNADHPSWNSIYTNGFVKHIRRWVDKNCAQIIAFQEHIFCSSMGYLDVAIIRNFSFPYTILADHLPVILWYSVQSYGLNITQSLSTRCQNYTFLLTQKVTPLLYHSASRSFASPYSSALYGGFLIRIGSGICTSYLRFAAFKR